MVAETTLGGDFEKLQTQNPLIHIINKVSNKNRHTVDDVNNEKYILSSWWYTTLSHLGYLYAAEIVSMMFMSHLM